MIKKLRAGLVVVLLLAITVRVLWWTIEPMLPYVLVGFVIVTIAGFVVYRTRRW